MFEWEKALVSTGFDFDYRTEFKTENITLQN